jgi:hypothetical protein
MIGPCTNIVMENNMTRPSPTEMPENSMIFATVSPSSPDREYMR